VPDDGTDIAACRLEHLEPIEAAPAHRCVLHLQGRWRLDRLAALDAQLRGLDGLARNTPAPQALQALQVSPTSPTSPTPATPATLAIDGSSLAEIDTAAALLLATRLAAAGHPPVALTLQGFDASHRRIVALVLERFAQTEPDPAPPPIPGRLARFGQAAAAFGALLAGHLTFLGRVLADLAQLASRPQLLRTNELVAQIHQTGLRAIPVVILVTFLIGLVFAYLLGLQAEQFGANIFVVDGVALGMTRELSPLLVATIVAGRSGAAFTAQLGTMRLTEETDAIRTLGLSPEQVLVVPRVMALVLVLPLLVFVGNVASLSGAMLMAATTLDITPTTFIDRLHDALAPRHYLIGLAKAPVFAFFIAVIGCRMGFSVERDTRSVGINTTSTVVQCIVAVILLDAFFAVFFQEIGL
jgi:phospholipid/cholesterol/gamma-HCH transport system permease protein